jgi:hypothetical protein
MTDKTMAAPGPRRPALRPHRLRALPPWSLVAAGAVAGALLGGGDGRGGTAVDTASDQRRPENTE